MTQRSADCCLNRDYLHAKLQVLLCFSEQPNFFFSLFQFELQICELSRQDSYHRQTINQIKQTAPESVHFQLSIHSGDCPQSAAGPDGVESEVAHGSGAKRRRQGATHRQIPDFALALLALACALRHLKTREKRREKEKLCCDLGCQKLPLPVLLEQLLCHVDNPLLIIRQ